MADFYINVRGKSLRKLAKLLTGPAAQKALVEVGQYWHREILPIHFTTAAYGKYGYRQRGANKKGQRGKQLYTKAGEPFFLYYDAQGVKHIVPGAMTDYNARKQREKGHQNPLVWSGALKAVLTAAARFEATPTKVRILMQGGPSWLKGRIAFNKGRGPNMEAEITKVTPGELHTLAEVAANSLSRQLNMAQGA